MKESIGFIIGIFVGLLIGLIIGGDYYRYLPKELIVVGINSKEVTLKHGYIIPFDEKYSVGETIKIIN